MRIPEDGRSRINKEVYSPNSSPTVRTRFMLTDKYSDLARKSRKTTTLTPGFLLVIISIMQAHSSVERAALVAAVTMRQLPTKREDNFAVTGRTLESAIREDIADGLIPFFVSLPSLRLIADVLNRYHDSIRPDYVIGSRYLLLTSSFRCARRLARRRVARWTGWKRLARCALAAAFGCTSTPPTRAPPPSVPSIGTLSTESR